MGWRSELIRLADTYIVGHSGSMKAKIRNCQGTTSQLHARTADDLVRCAHSLL